MENLDEIQTPQGDILPMWTGGYCKGAALIQILHTQNKIELIKSIKYFVIQSCLEF